MDDYQLPEKTLTMRALVKASSAVGLYFICPVCHMELLYPDERLASGLRNCPLCHTALEVPQGEERNRIIKRVMDAYIP
jgi:hypothetical protein